MWSKITGIRIHGPDVARPSCWTVCFISCARRNFLKCQSHQRRQSQLRWQRHRRQGRLVSASKSVCCLVEVSHDNQLCVNRFRNFVPLIDSEVLFKTMAWKIRHRSFSFDHDASTSPKHTILYKRDPKWQRYKVIIKESFHDVMRSNARFTCSSFC